MKSILTNRKLAARAAAFMRDTELLNQFRSYKPSI
jgi:hypothetical protein